MKDSNFHIVSAKRDQVCDLYRDYTDGSVYGHLPKDSVDLILYQDEFEIVNPLSQIAI